MALSLKTSSLQSSSSRQLLLPTAMHDQELDMTQPIRNDNCKLSTLKVVAYIISAFAKVFFVPISLQLPKGWAFAFGNTASFFVLESWAATKTLEEMFSTRSKINPLFCDLKPPKSLPNRYLILAGVIALFSQIPQGYAAYNYNADKYKIAAASVTIFAGALFPLRSLQLSLSKSFARKRLDDHQKKLMSLKKELLVLVRTSHDSFLSKPLQEQLEYYLSADGIDDLEGAKNKTLQYSQQVFGTKTVTPLPKSTCRKVSENILYLGGHVLNATLQTAIGMYTYTQTKQEIYDSDALAIFFSTLTVGSNVYLMGSSIIDTSANIFNSLVDFVMGNAKKTASGLSKPKLTFLLSLLGIIINGFGLGPTIVIWGDFYSDNKIEQLFFQITLSMAIFLVLFTATLDFITNVVESYIEQCGTEDEQHVLSICKEFREVESLLLSISLEDIEPFLSKLPEDFQMNLKEKFGLVKQSLKNLREEFGDT